MLQVKILRPESYWFNQVGKVVSVDQVRQWRVNTRQMGLLNVARSSICNWGSASAMPGGSVGSWSRRSQQLTLLPTCFRSLQSGIRYPVVVRFENQNYAGVSTNNYALDEVVEAK